MAPKIWIGLIFNYLYFRCNRTGLLTALSIGGYVRLAGKRYTTRVISILYSLFSTIHRFLPSNAHQQTDNHAAVPIQSTMQSSHYFKNVALLVRVTVIGGKLPGGLDLFVNPSDKPSTQDRLVQSDRIFHDNRFEAKPRLAKEFTLIFSFWSDRPQLSPPPSPSSPHDGVSFHNRSLK